MELPFGVTEGIDDAVLGRWYEGGHPIFYVAGIVFVVGHVIGTVLLGIAMWRSRAVPRWAAAITAVAQPLHFVAAVVIASHPLDLSRGA